MAAQGKRPPKKARTDGAADVSDVKEPKADKMEIDANPMPSNMPTPNDSAKAAVVPNESHEPAAAQSSAAAPIQPLQREKHSLDDVFGDDFDD